MRVDNITKVEGNLLDFRVTVDGAEWADVLQNASVMAQKNNPIPGYRAGKAPLAIALKHFGGQLVETTARGTIFDFFVKAVQENNFEPVDEPKFAITSCNDKEFQFVTTVFVYPEVTLKQYKGIEVERPDDVVTEEQIDAELESFRDLHRIVNVVERPAGEGDIVYLDYAATCNGEKFSDSSMSDVSLRIGRDEIFTGLDARVLGKSAGDVFTCTLTMPDDFRRAEIAGKTIEVKVRIRQVKERVLPELTDELIAKYRPKLGTIEAFRADMRATLEKYAKMHSDEVFAENVKKALAAQVEANIPLIMIDRQLEIYYNNMRANLAGQGKTLEQYLAEIGWTPTQLKNESMPRATEAIKLVLAQEEIARREGFTLTDEELNKEYALISHELNCPVSVAKVKIDREQCAERILSRMALKLVTDNAVVVTK